MKISIIGSGNVATFLGLKLKESFHIVQVISQNINHAKELAAKLNCEFDDDIQKLNKKIDILIFAVKDDVLIEYVSKIHLENILVIHCAGSISLNQINAISSHTACIWPVYSIHKNKLPPKDFDIPLVLQANCETSKSVVLQLSESISAKHFFLNDEQKSYLHLAAVFVNNFTNHFYHLGQNICQQHQISFDILKPIILQTAQNIQTINPSETQTGPAIRRDLLTIEKHLLQLTDKEVQTLYSIISENIQKMNP